MRKVFVCYRRDDSAGHAGRIVDHLKRSLGEENVFQDVFDIAPGKDFQEAIKRALDESDAFVSVIGRNWLGKQGTAGESRLQDEEDYPRKELAFALDHEISVIPVLVDGARPPTLEELPEPLHKLARIHALKLSDERWLYDIGRLEEALEVEGPEAAPESGETKAGARPKWLRAGAAAAAVLALGAVIVGRSLGCGAEKSATGYYLVVAGGPQMMMTPKNLKSQGQLAELPDRRDIVGWCLKSTAGTAEPLAVEDLWWCEPGAYLRTNYNRGDRIGRDNVIVVEELRATLPRFNDCLVGDASAGTRLEDRDLEDC